MKYYYVVRFNSGPKDSLLWFFRNKKAVEPEIFRDAVCYEIPEQIDVDDLVNLQVTGTMRSCFKQLWNK